MFSFCYKLNQTSNKQPYLTLFRTETSLYLMENVPISECQRFSVGYMLSFVAWKLFCDKYSFTIGLDLDHRVYWFMCKDSSEDTLHSRVWYHATLTRKSKFAHPTIGLPGKLNKTTKGSCNIICSLCIDCGTTTTTLFDSDTKANISHRGIATGIYPEINVICAKSLSRPKCNFDVYNDCFLRRFSRKSTAFILQ